jgi:hypothetical protein
MARVQGYRSGSSSIVAYIVVGVILAAIVIGGVYLAKHQLLAYFTPAETGSVATVDGDQNTSVDTTKQSNDQSKNKSDKAKSSGKEQTAGETSTKGKLPATGPGDVFGQASALAILSGAGVFYVRSRRA